MTRAEYKAQLEAEHPGAYHRIDQYLIEWDRMHGVPDEIIAQVVADNAAATADLEPASIEGADVIFNEPDSSDAQEGE